MSDVTSELRALLRAGTRSPWGPPGSAVAFAIGADGSPTIGIGPADGATDPIVMPFPPESPHLARGLYMAALTIAWGKHREREAAEASAPAATGAPR